MRDRDPTKLLLIHGATHYSALTDMHKRIEFMSSANADGSHHGLMADEQLQQHITNSLEQRGRRDDERGVQHDQLRHPGSVTADGG